MLFSKLRKMKITQDSVTRAGAVNLTRFFKGTGLYWEVIAEDICCLNKICISVDAGQCIKIVRIINCPNFTGYRLNIPIGSQVHISGLTHSKLRRNLEHYGFSKIPSNDSSVNIYIRKGF